MLDSFGSTYPKIGTIQRRLAWPLHKDDMQICEVFHIKKKKKAVTERSPGTPTQKKGHERQTQKKTPSSN